MTTGYVKKVGNNFYVRYANNTAWVYVPENMMETLCCPLSSLSSWEDPGVVCNDPKITRSIDLTSPYYLWGGVLNPPTTQQLSILCGAPPNAYLSSQIKVKIPYDPIFSGTYTFDYNINQNKWMLNVKNSENITLSVYNDTNSSFYNKRIIDLTETTGIPTYQGYVEVAKNGNISSDISGVYAFPARFIFSAIEPPSDANSQTPFPTTSGHKAVVGFNLPIRYRSNEGDWIVVDQQGHKLLTTQTSNLLPSGYATNKSGAYTISLSGITNNPPQYNLSDTTTAIIGTCTGLAYMGFGYKSSASGLPFDNVSYGVAINDFIGSRPTFLNRTINYNSSNYILNETNFFSNKTPIEAWISFTFSCRPSGTECSSLNSLDPVSTGFSTINGSCQGSYINVDYVCGDNTPRPDATYFNTEGITNISVAYSGLPENIYPFVKASNNTGNVYKAGQNQVIYIDYPGPHTPNDFRTWINRNFNFVEIDNSNNITRKWPGIDLRWSKIANTTTVLAALKPCDSAPNESSCPGVVITSVNGSTIWSTSEFFGEYAHDQQNNRYINLRTGDDSIQIRFIIDRWHLGKIENGIFVTYYTLTCITGGIPSDLYNTIGWFSLDGRDLDYSNYAPTNPNLGWNSSTCIPVDSRSLPTGKWTNELNTYPGVGGATSARNPFPSVYGNSSCC